MNKISKVIILDSKPLAEICNPLNYQKTQPLIKFLKDEKIALKIAEITDYELRRELTLRDLHKGISNLNKFAQRKQIIPLCRESLIIATKLWADLRKAAQPTADNKNIDCDVIMVAQALKLQDRYDQIIILTIDVKDLVRFKKFGIEVWDWKQALVDWKYKEVNLYNPLSFK